MNKTKKKKIRDMKDPRRNEMLKMKQSGKTNIAIAKHFGISNQRICQIVGIYKPNKRVNINCPYCKTLFYKYPSSTQKYCSLKCARASVRLRPDKPVSKYTEKELKAYNKKSNDSKKEYRKEYYQRPEVKARMKEYRKTDIYINYQKDHHKKNYKKVIKK